LGIITTKRQKIDIKRKKIDIKRKKIATKTKEIANNRQKKTPIVCMIYHNPSLALSFSADNLVQFK
jgi:tryptophan synthase alpha subunit